MHGAQRPAIGSNIADNHRASYCLILSLAALMRAAIAPSRYFPCRVGWRFVLYRKPLHLSRVRVRSGRVRQIRVSL